MGYIDYMYGPQLKVMDQLDLKLLNGETATYFTIPASSVTLPAVIMTALAKNILQLQYLSSIGEFLGLYKNPTAASTTTIPDAVIGLGSGYLPVDWSVGSVIGIRNMKDAEVTGTSNNLVINFLGI